MQGLLEFLKTGRPFPPTKVFNWPRTQAKSFPPPPPPAAPPLNMISWNCRRAGGGNTLRVLWHLVKKHKPHCLFLLETKTSSSRINNIRNSLSFTNSEIIEAKGTAGGMVLMWSDDLQLMIDWTSHRIISGVIRGLDGKDSWCLFGCHGTPYRKENATFWNQLESMVLDCDLPWLLRWSEQNHGLIKKIWRKKLVEETPLLKEFCPECRGHWPWLLREKVYLRK